MPKKGAGVSAPGGGGGGGGVTPEQAARLQAMLQRLGGLGGAAGAGASAAGLPNLAVPVPGFEELRSPDFNPLLFGQRGGPGGTLLWSREQVLNHFGLMYRSMEKAESEGASVDRIE
jgi:hypothetical protein